MSKKKTKKKVRKGWWNGEQLIRVSEIADHVPPNANGSPVSIATVYRWVTDGIDGVVIRRFKLGGQWHTSIQEIDRWVEKLNMRGAR